MAELSFEEFVTQIQQHFEGGSYADGLELLDRQAANFPEHIPLMSLWRISFLASLDAVPEANQVLERALESGIWYAEPVLRNGQALQNLQQDPEFERLVDISSQMQSVDPTAALPLLAVHSQGRCAMEGAPCPLLLVLHDNQDTAHENLPHWRSAAEAGWLLALPQSQQGLWAGAYSWGDPLNAAEEVEGHFNNLCSRYHVDRQQVVLAGLGAGAEIALLLALSDRFPLAGFILLQPRGALLSDPAELASLAQASRNRNQRGVVFFDETGNGAVPLAQLAERLNEAGIRAEQEGSAGWEDGYPPDFPNRLQAALDFILQTQDNP